MRSITVNYFPKNLENIFPNLIAVAFQTTELKEIHQEDVKPFGQQLEYFQVHNCYITIIEKDLFKFNPNLKAILIDRNRIKYVEGNAFDHLNQLVSLFMERNECINENSKENRQLTLQVISTVKGECYSNYKLLNNKQDNDNEDVSMEIEDESLKKDDSDDSQSINRNFAIFNLVFQIILVILWRKY